MVLEFSREKEVATQNLSTPWLSSGPMLSKPPFVLKLFRSHISAKMFFTDASFQLREKDHTIKVLHLFYYAKPSRRSFENIYITQRRNVVCFFSSWTLEVVFRSQKGLVSIPGFSFAPLVVTHCVIWLN